jgi:hypothetical protein
VEREGLISSKFCSWISGCVIIQVFSSIKTGTNYGPESSSKIKEALIFSVSYHKVSQYQPKWLAVFAFLYYDNSSIAMRMVGTEHAEV